MLPRLLIALSLCVLPGLAWTQAVENDPLESVMWPTVRDLVLEGTHIEFNDERIKVYAPNVVEDGMHVPVSVAVHGIDDIKEILVLADHNPIPKVLSYKPMKADPALAFRIKVQEATPVRAAVLTKDGTWYVGGVWVDAPGGGCTTPSASQTSRLWEEKLNVVQGKIWKRNDGGDRLRVRMIHPMDTGLIDSIPAFYLEQLELQSADGSVLARLKTFEPVSENPTLTFSIPKDSASKNGYRLVGRDSDGNDLVAWVKERGGHLMLSPKVKVAESY